MKNGCPYLALYIIPEQGKMLLSIPLLEIRPLGYRSRNTIDKSTSRLQRGSCIKFGCLKTSGWKQVDEYLYPLLLQNRDHIVCLPRRLFDKSCQMFWIPIKSWTAKHLPFILEINPRNPHEIIRALLDRFTDGPIDFGRRNIECHDDVDILYVVATQRGE